MNDKIYQKGIEECVVCHNHLKPGDIYVDLGWGKAHTTCFVRFPYDRIYGGQEDA